jgi:hypothetical protein
MRDIVMARLASRFDLEQSRKHRSE